jgi:hypothetical protein
MGGHMPNRTEDGIDVSEGMIKLEDWEIGLKGTAFLNSCQIEVRSIHTIKSAKKNVASLNIANIADVPELIIEHADLEVEYEIGVDHWYLESVTWLIDEHTMMDIKDLLTDNYCALIHDYCLALHYQPTKDDMIGNDPRI